MRFRQNNKVKSLMTAVILLSLLAVIVAGCTATTTQPKGWSGVAISDNNLFAGSSTGKLIGIEEATGNRLFNDLSLETGSSGGFLGCGAAPVAVAIYSTPLVSGDKVYVAGYNGKVYSVDANKGIKGWSFQPERGLQPIIGGLAIDQNALFFGTASGYVYSIDATTSSQNWEFKTGNKIWATPLIDNGTLYIGSFDKKLYALNIADGKEKWQVKTDGAIISTPVVENNTLYFGTLDRYFYAVDATNGNLKWKSSEIAGKWFWANPILVNNVIYAPNMDGKVYVLNAENGQNIIAPIVIASPISSSPVIVGDDIILAAQDGKVWSINTNDNIMKLLIDLGGQIQVSSKIKIAAALSSSQDVVYIHTQDGKFYALNASSGEAQVWNSDKDSWQVSGK
jgi:outer membrane protein assembly factor BamB